MADPSAAAPPAAEGAAVHEPSARLLELLRQINVGEHDAAIDALERRRRTLCWDRLPSKIVLLRHGQSEGNVDRVMYSYKGDSFLELTPHGRQQAREAGARLRQVVGDGRVFVCLSPFERTQQTYLAACEGGFPAEQVGVLHVDPQIREQEFGNFQDPGLTSKVRAEEKRVGRFYYRRPNGESSADVFDRVNQFWNKLLSDGNDALLLGRRDTYDNCVVVTHGLTIRLLLMRIFDWSVETFETVWNLGNACHLTLRKNMDTLSYELDPGESFPPRLPWATREVSLVMKSLQASETTEAKIREMHQLRDSHQWETINHTLGLERTIDEMESQRMTERSRPYTIVDYLAVPRPRTTETREVLARLVPGHDLRGTPEELLARVEPPPLEEVEAIDWWGDLLGCHAKAMRSQRSHESEPCWSIHNHLRGPMDHRLDGLRVQPQPPPRP